MAGTGYSVKRMWSFFTQSGVRDAFRAFFEEINNLTADVETLRIAILNSMPTCIEAGTTSDLTVGDFAFLDSDGVLQIVDSVTETDVGTTTVTLNTWGTLLYQVDNTGAGSFKAEATQAYTSALLALASAVSPDADNLAAFYCLIEADAGDWVANTDDFSSDLEAFAIIPAGAAVAASLTAATMTTPESQD